MEMTPTQPQETEQQKDVRLNKDLAAFSYVWIISVVVYALRKDSPFIRYHSRQAMVLFVASIIVYLIPWIGQYLLYIVVAGMLFGFVNASQGNMTDVPFAGKIAKGEYTWASASSDMVNIWRRLRRTGASLQKPERIASPAVDTGQSSLPTP